MSGVTGWVLRTWLKWTVLLAVLVGGVWLFTGAHGWFWITLVLAGVAEWWLVRQLAREWAHEASLTWWGTR